MKKTNKKNITADEIAEMADRGEDVTKFYSGNGEMKEPQIQRVNVDFSASMLDELDIMAKKLNISRQAVIKSFLRQAIDQHYLATNKKVG